MLRKTLSALSVLLLASAAHPPRAVELQFAERPGVRVVYAQPNLAPSAEAAADHTASLLTEQHAALGVEPPPLVSVSLVAGYPDDPATARALGLDGMPAWAAGMTRGAVALIAVRIDRIGRYPDRSLRTVLAHEVAHLMLDRALGTYRPSEVPSWFNEGYAMTEASRYGVGHRWTLGRSLLFAGPIPLDQLERSWPRTGPRARAAYAQVYSFLDHVLDKVGDHGARRVVHLMREGEGFHAAWREVTGRSPETWHRAWRRSVTFWYRWVPFLTSGGTLWFVVSVLFVTAYAHRRRKSRAILDRWEAEERFEDPSPDKGPEQLH